MSESSPSRLPPGAALDQLIAELHSLSDTMRGHADRWDYDQHNEEDVRWYACAVGRIAEAIAGSQHMSEDEHDPLCAMGTWAGDQRMPCDCDAPRITTRQKDEDEDLAARVDSVPEGEHGDLPRPATE